MVSALNRMLPVLAAACVIAATPQPSAQQPINLAQDEHDRG